MTDYCNPNMSDSELQRFFIFSVLSANKPAERMWKLTDEFCATYPNVSPFCVLTRLIDNGLLFKRLQELKTGQYGRIYHALKETIEQKIDLRACDAAELMTVPGIGPKIARYFIQRTRPGAKVAVLDTHILKWLREQGYDVPRATPSGKKYRDIEKKFLDLCDEADCSPAEADMLIWESYKRN